MNEIRRRGIKVPVLLGIVMLKNAGMAKYMNASVPGVKVPDAIIARLTAAKKEDREKVSIDICGELISKSKHCCQGARLHDARLGPLRAGNHQSGGTVRISDCGFRISELNGGRTALEFSGCLPQLARSKHRHRPATSRLPRTIMP